MIRGYVAAAAWLLTIAMMVSSGKADDAPARADDGFVRIEPGEYQRGESDMSAINRDHPYSLRLKGNATWNERPKHRVVLTKPFDMATHEVTVAEFRAFVEDTGYVTDAEKNGTAAGFDSGGKRPPHWIEIDPKYSWRNPGFAQKDSHPVVCVSWHDAQEYCHWLSRQNGMGCRLPTEAEWEYAARAGTQTWYSWGNKPDDAYQHANVADATLERTHENTTLYQRSFGLDSDSCSDGFAFTAPAGSYRPNPWGLFDVHGNVWEWCQDIYEEDHYARLVSPFPKRERDSVRFEDPTGPETTTQQKHGNWRVLRGGGWYTGPISSRSAMRAFAEASDGLCYAGFRLVRDIDTDSVDTDSVDTGSVDTGSKQ